MGAPTDLPAEIPAEMPAGVTHVIIRGGSFDPPTLAHVETACRARAAWQPEAFLLFVPAAQSPHKDHGPRASEDDRLAMLRLAIAGVPRAGISSVELDRPPPSYTIDTLRVLRARWPEARAWRLLMGSDQAIQFHRWRSPREIIALAPPLVVVRPPHRSRAEVVDALVRTEAWSKAELEQWGDWVAPVRPRAGSATHVRAALARGERARLDLAPEVLAYIASRGLYGCAPGASGGA